MAYDSQGYRSVFLENLFVKITYKSEKTEVYESLIANVIISECIK
jgi:hypothetical protein